MRNPGWLMLLIVVLIEGFSGFGRTASFSPFLKDICRDLAITSSQISAAYGFANLLTGFLLPRVGRFYDRCSASRFLSLFVALFGTTFLFFSSLKIISMPPFANCMILFFCFANIRLSVQSYMLTGRCLISAWFIHNRGFATGLNCLILSFIASSIPWLALHASYHFSWNQFWSILGASWLCIMLFLARWVRKPTDSIHPNPSTQNQPNSFPYPEKNCPHPFLRTNKTDLSCQKSPAFFLIMAMLFFKAFQMTSLSFHLIPMCEEFHAKAENVTLCLIGTPILTIITTFVVGHFFEKIGIRTSIFAFLVLDIFLLFSFQFIGNRFCLYTFGITAGAYWGIRQIIAYMILPKLFGTQTIGAINGWASACLCIGSATGPYIFAKLHEWHSYALALQSCQGMAILLLLLFFFLFKYIKPQE